MLDRKGRSWVSCHWHPSPQGRRNPCVSQESIINPSRLYVYQQGLLGRASTVCTGTVAAGAQPGFTSALYKPAQGRATRSFLNYVVCMSYPATVQIETPDRIAFWRPLVQWFLAIPHLLIAGVLGTVSQLVAVISWFAIVFTGRLPAGLADFQAMRLRYELRIQAYIAFLHDEYRLIAFWWGVGSPRGVSESTGSGDGGRHKRLWGATSEAGGPLWKLILRALLMMIGTPQSRSGYLSNRHHLGLMEPNGHCRVGW